MDRNLLRHWYVFRYFRKLLPNLSKLLDSFHVVENAARGTKTFRGYLKCFNLIAAFPPKSKDGVWAAPDSYIEVIQFGRLPLRFRALFHNVPHEVLL